MQKLKQQIRDWQEDYRAVLRRKPKVPRITVPDSRWMKYRFTYSPEIDTVHVHYRFLFGEWGTPSDYKARDFLKTIDDYVHLSEEAKQKIRDWMNSFT